MRSQRSWWQPARVAGLEVRVEFAASLGATAWLQRRKGRQMSLKMRLTLWLRGLGCGCVMSGRDCPSSRHKATLTGNLTRIAFADYEVHWAEMKKNGKLQLRGCHQFALRWKAMDWYPAQLSASLCKLHAATVCPLMPSRLTEAQGAHVLATQLTCARYQTGKPVWKQSCKFSEGCSCKAV